MSWAVQGPGASARTFSGISAGSAGTFSNVSATDVGRQFNTVGPFVNGDYTDFVLSVDESHPIYLSETALPYITLQEVMGDI